ncbi:SRPBCC domain-containing protein [Oricola sp.]|uniref:SRPBCC family protein n=1 Tax=Oricola sp. TaxID=1979950 RepID=UPI0025EA480C|nr:SRPBCC domain-containing protein [Oricola sp.]MCI5078463.1 SRPBCC domain-containing protein [Oricola sp.]
MTTDDAGKDDVLQFEADLDAPPEKVWRAVTVPELRAQWLPDSALADAEPVSETPGVRVSYRMRDDEAPHLESLATFDLSPNGEGGTRLVIRHRLTDAGAARVPANGNGTVMRLAA